jgi:hypothetical protein
MPEGLEGLKLYELNEQGYEKTIKERMEKIRSEAKENE